MVKKATRLANIACASTGATLVQRARKAVKAARAKRARAAQSSRARAAQASVQPAAQAAKGKGKMRGRKVY